MLNILLRLLGLSKKSQAKITPEFDGEWVVEHPCCEFNGECLGHRFVVPEGTTNREDWVICRLIQSTTTESRPFVQTLANGTTRNANITIWRKSPAVQIPSKVLAPRLEVSGRNMVVEVC